MSWEVRTMRSGTSYFNTTLLGKNLARFWPIWGVYALSWLLLLPVGILLQADYWDAMQARSYPLALASNGGFSLVLTFLFGILCAMAVFSYLYSARSVGMLHALPMRREGLFLTNYLSGLLFLIVPNFAVFLLALVAEALNGAVVFSSLFVWLVVTSFSGYRGINFTTFFPETYTLDNYINVLFHPDSVAQFPQWFANTLIVAVFNCVISTCFVLMVAYAFSCCRFKSRRLLQNLSVTVNLFPGVLAMIAVYFVLRYLNLTNSYAGLIMVYAGSSGLGYLICKGFFDTVPVSLREAAKLDGASEARIFFQVVIPMSRPILVYTIINSFMMPWTDFVMAKMILNSGVSADWTVAIGLYNMLSRTLVNNYFALFCAGGVLVSIPISVLFVIMQKFYVEGITSGADKG